MSRRVERICFLTDAPHFGGAERYLLDMCAATQRRSIQVHIHWIAPGSVHESASDQIEPDWLQRKLCGQHVSFSRQMGYGFAALCDTLQRQMPDAVVINASGRPGMWRSTWACRLLGVPSAWVHHMVDCVDPRRLPPRYLNGRMEGLSLWRIPQTLRHRLAAIGARAVFSSNIEDAEYLHRWGLATANKIHVVSPGIDPDRWNCDTKDRFASRQHWLPGLPEDTFVVGTAARLVDGKGIELLIEAIAQLATENPSVALLIAGTGPRQESLEQLVRNCKLDAHVRFVEFVEDMREFYHALDVFALCSTTESFGLTIAEAMACGVTVIATPTHGARRQIRHLHNGMLTEGFAAHSVALCLRELQHNRALLQRLGQQARESATTAWAIDHTLDATLEAIVRPSDRPNSALCMPAPASAVLAPEVFA